MWRETQTLQNLCETYQKYYRFRYIQKSRRMSDESVKVTGMQKFYVNVCRPVFFVLCASVSIIVSLTIVLSDFLLIDSSLVAFSPLYQIMSLAKKHGLESLAVFFIYYIHIVYLIYGLMDTRLFVTFFKLTDKHGTDAKSLMFFVNRLTSMVFCLSWNIASVL